MPITALQRERLERALRDHDARVNGTERQLTSTSETVHRILLDLGKNEQLLDFISDFVDSADLGEEARRDPASVLSARGIELPDNVTMRVLDGYGVDPKPILRFEVTVRNATVFADWDPDVGACVRLAGRPQ